MKQPRMQTRSSSDLASTPFHNSSETLRQEHRNPATNLRYVLWKAFRRYDAISFSDIDTWCRTLSSFREAARIDRKSTRLNSSHVAISYAVFCLKKKNKKNTGI